MQIAALGYVGVEATEPQAWVDFGPTILGLAVSPESPDGAVLLRMDQRSYRLAVHRGPTNRLAYLGWEVPSGAGLQQAYRELEEAGAEPRRGSPEECEARHVHGLVHCTDPAGNAIELFYGQRTVCETFLPTRSISGFLTDDLGLGHVVLSVPNIEAAQQFYAEVLGFRISDLFLNRLVFFHCNPRHHSLALGQLGNAGLNHIMLEVKNIDDVGTTYDLCREKRVPISRALGRHSNDLMFSFYMEGPSGFDIEYGWNGRLVDDRTWTVQQIDRGSLWGHEPVSERAKARFGRLSAPPRGDLVAPALTSA